MAINNNGFGNGILIYAACAAAAWYFWPQIKAALGPDTTPYGSGYQQPAGRLGPPNNHSGVTPWDPFGLRNRLLGGALGMRLDPGEVSRNVEDRRGEYPGQMAGLRCRDTYTGQDVPLSLCDAEHGGAR